MNNRRGLTLTALIALWLSACASTPEQQDLTQSLTDDALKERISEAICVDDIETGSKIVWQSSY